MRLISSFFQRFILVLAAVFMVSTAAQGQSNFSISEIEAAPDCGRFPSDQDGYLCNCAAGFTLSPVWGSGPYTADSNICSAAVHSGVVSKDGGAVFVTARPGQDRFVGSEKNGVNTANWGAYGRSFVIEVAQPSFFLQACTELAFGQDKVTCACGTNTGDNAGVWGSGPYTADSNICAAARHAGYLDDGPGTVTALRIQGLDSYAGSEWNGILTSGREAYESSLVFDGN